MMPTPLAQAHDEITALLHGAAPDLPWNAAARDPKPLASGLGHVAAYDFLTSLLLAARGRPSRYWAPRRTLTLTYNLQVPADAQPALIHHLQPDRSGHGPDRLAAYPVYNLADTAGEAATHLLSEPPAPQPLPDRVVADTVWRLVSDFPHTPTLDFSTWEHTPVYDLSRDTIRFGKDGASRGRMYPVLCALAAATAHPRRLGRPVHPPAREALVVSLTAASLAHGCGLRRLPRDEPPETFLAYARQDPVGFFAAARDADAAAAYVNGWAQAAPDHAADAALAT